MDVPTSTTCDLFPVIPHRAEQLLCIVVIRWKLFEFAMSSWRVRIWRMRSSSSSNRKRRPWQILQALCPSAQSRKPPVRKSCTFSPNALGSHSSIWVSAPVQPLARPYASNISISTHAQLHAHTGGDLGWFKQKSLEGLEPEIFDIVFQVRPNNLQKVG